MAAIIAFGAKQRKKGLSLWADRSDVTCEPSRSGWASKFCLKVWAWIKVRGWKHGFVKLRAFQDGKQRYLSLSPGEAVRLAKSC